MKQISTIKNSQQKKTVGQGDKGRQAVPAPNKGAQRSMHVFT